MDSHGNPTEPSTEIRRTHYFLMLLLALLVAFSFQGSRGLYESTEGRYAEAGREMLETGNFLVPTLDYQPHWTKPPMTYWAIAGGIALVGRNEWGVRLYLAVAFVLSALVVAAMAHTLWDAKTGLLAGLIYLSTPYAVAGAVSVTTDMLLTFFMLLAMLCYFRALKAGDPALRWRWIVAMWLGWGLAFLTKGPPGLLPLIPLIIWNRRRSDSPRLANPLGLLLFATVGLTWYVVVSARNEGLLGYFLGQEVVGRLSEDSRNPEWYKPFLYYLPPLTVGLGAWAWYAFPLFARERLYKPKSFLRRATDRNIGGLLLLWTFIPLAIFFVVTSRLFYYVLPLLCPIVLATARWMTLHCDRDGMGLRRWIRIALVSSLILVGMKGAATFRSSDSDMRLAVELFDGLDPGKTVFYSVDQSKYFGLQFYLDGNLIRLSTRANADFARAEIEETIPGTAGAPAGKGAAYLIRQRRERILQERFDALGVDYSLHRKHFWSLFIVENPGTE